MVLVVAGWGGVVGNDARRAEHSDEFPDDVVGLSAFGFDDLCAGVDCEGGVLSAGVALVPGAQVGAHFFNCSGNAAGLQLLEAPFCANFGGGGEKYFEGGVGEDGGGHVASVGDEAGGSALGALEGEEFGADGGDGGDAGGAFAGFGGVEGGVCEGGLEGGWVFGEVSGGGFGVGGFGSGGGVGTGGWVGVGEGDGAVEGAGVQVVEVEGLGEEFGDGSLSGSGGAVNGDDRRGRRGSRRGTGGLCGGHFCFRLNFNAGAGDVIIWGLWREVRQLAGRRRRRFPAGRWFARATRGTARRRKATARRRCGGGRVGLSGFAGRRTMSCATAIRFIRALMS